MSVIKGQVGMLETLRCVARKKGSLDTGRMKKGGNELDELDILLLNVMFRPK